MIRRLFIAFLVVLTITASAPPAQAIGAFAPAVTIVPSGCGPGDTNHRGDAVMGSDGVSRGFVEFSGPSCTDGRIWYFEGSAGTWSPTRSPYLGEVLGVADDGTATYLLHATTQGIRITKRTHAGVFTGGRVISRHGSSFPEGSGTQGDVVAAAGTWWAVWTERVPAGDENAPTSLFQAKTYGIDRAQERITIRGDDKAPSLALKPGGGAVLVWSRILSGEPDPVFVADIRVATSADGAWSSRPFATLGDANFSPDVFAAGAFTYITWVRDMRIVVADNRGGAFRSHTFGTTGFEPRVSASVGKLFVAWNKCCSTLNHAFVAERAGSSWSGVDLTPGVTSNQSVTSVAAIGGKATVFVTSEGVDRLYARTQT